MSIRKRRAQRHSRTHIVSLGIAGFFGFIFLLIGSIGISLGFLVNNWLSDLPDYESADAYLVAEPTQVIAGDGTTVIASYYLQNRRSVDLENISDFVIKGTIDVEDERFFKHNGVDPQGIIRAIFSQLVGRSEGASTITQQLVRNTVLSDEQFERTLKRKVREAYIAIQMEKKYTKNQILNMYLNTIYYGHGAYGIEAASITYFNKHASDLTLAEAATLIGIPNSPSYYDPTVNPDACTKRRNHVLKRMLTVGDISQKEYEGACAEPIALNLGSFGTEQSKSPYFTDYVRQLLEEDFDRDVILKGGLKVYTTLDLNAQQAAETAVSDTVNQTGNEKLQAACVAIDPATGYIKAMVGGKDYAISQFNMATQARRQVGSTFKMFTTVAALQAGVSPNTYIDCRSPKQITSNWTVRNVNNTSLGTITFTSALAESSNTGFAQVAVGIGPDKIVKTAHDMGLDVDLPTYPSITLGTIGIPPVQMAEAYATLASGGVHRDGVAITKIEDRNGNVVYEHKDNPTQAVPTEIAQAATEMLTHVITDGTARTLLSRIKYDQPVAGKTGTTQNNRDIWFCGITPQLSVAIWCGYETEEPIVVYRGSESRETLAVSIFARFTNAVLENTARQEFPTSEKTPTYKKENTWGFSVPYTKPQEKPETPPEEESLEEPEEPEVTETPDNPGQDTPSTPTDPTDSSTEPPEPSEPATGNNQ